MESAYRVQEPRRVLPGGTESARVEGGTQHGSDAVRSRHAVTRHRSGRHRWDLCALAALDLRDCVSRDGIRPVIAVATVGRVNRRGTDGAPIRRDAGGSLARRQGDLLRHDTQLHCPRVGAACGNEYCRALLGLERVAPTRRVSTSRRSGDVGRRASDVRWNRGPRGLDEDGQQPDISGRHTGGRGVVLGHWRAS